MPVTRPSSRSAARSLQRGTFVLAATVLTLGALAGLVASCGNDSAPSPTATDPPPATATPTTIASPSPSSTPPPAAAAPASASPTPTAADSASTGGDADSGQGLGLADSINQLAWVRDGLEGEERYAALLLQNIGSSFPLVLEALLSTEREFLPPRGLDDTGILAYLLSLSTADAGLALRAVDVVLARRQGAEAIAWFTLALHLDGRAPHLIYGDIEQLRYAVEQGTADEGLADNYLLYFQVKNEMAFRATAALPWVLEAGSLVRTAPGFTLLQAGLAAPDLFDVIAEKPWIEDGLSQGEISVIEDLISLFNYRSRALEDDVLRLARASFLDDISGLDVLALRSISYAEGNGLAFMEELFDHPLFSGDVGDSEASTLALLHVALRRDPSLETLDAVLEGEDLSRATREIELPSGKILTLVGISSGANAEVGLDTLEYAVVQVEQLMGVGFPLDTLTLITSDEYIEGAGFQSGIVRGSLSLSTNLYVMAHEVAHVYWGAPPTWVYEGAAELVASLVYYKDHEFGSDAPSPFDRGRCEAADNLEQVEAAGGYHRCVYIFGLGLFGSLYEALGEEHFWRGFRTLYELGEADAGRNVSLEGQRPVNPGLCYGEQQGLCYVRAAFVDAAEAWAARVADEVITLWYFGTPQADYGQ